MRDNEDQEVIEPSDTIDAFKFGSVVVPLSAAESGGYGSHDAGPKCLSVIQFIDQDEIPLPYLTGQGTMLFQAAEGNDYSIRALSALVEAMTEEGLAAVVRKVYRKGTSARLGVLVPEDRAVDGGPEQRVLVYLQLPFDNDVKKLKFASLTCDASPDQTDAMNALVDAMMLPPAEEEPLKANPYQQHLFHCLAKRALHPSLGKKLPRLEKHVREMLESSPNVAEATKEPIDRLKTLFKLEAAASRTSKQSGQEAFGNDLPRVSEAANETTNGSQSLDLDSSSVVTSVTSVSPVEDFRTLLAKGVSLQIRKFFHSESLRLKRMFRDQL